MKKRVKIIIILTFILLITYQFNYTSFKPVSAFEKTYSMTFGDYVAIHHTVPVGTDYTIKWSFSGTNVLIGIHAGVMDQSDYDDWDFGSPTTEVSDGTENKDSGKFKIPYEAIWYIVFYVTDIDALIDSTNLHVIVDYVIETANLPLILGLSIGLPLGLAAIILPIIIFAVLIPRRKQRKLLSSPKEVSDSSSLVNGHTVFCWKCGSKNPISNKYCGQCSAELAYKN
jgi:hypothetical protein